MPVKEAPFTKRDTLYKVGLTVFAVILFCMSAVPLGCSEEAALVVNGETVSKKQFDEEVSRRLSIVERRNPEELEGDKGKDLRAETKRQVATEMIRDVMMRQQADKLGVKVPGDLVGKKLEDERLLHGMDEFQRILESQGLTEDQYKETIEQQLLVEGLGEKVCENVSYNDEELETYYLTHKDMFKRAEMIHAAHILLDTETAAETVLQQLNSGRDFSSLAKTLSRDEATRLNGGDLGWIERGTMDPAFEQAAFSLAQGQVSGVVKASKGFHVIKVLERREVYEPPYKDIRQEVKEAYLSDNKETVFTDWLKTVYADADVELKSGIGRWDPLTGMVVRN